MPFHSFLFPVFIPLFLCSWTNEELHFHLFKLSHAKNKLPCYDLITKCFPYLCNSKRNFHSSGFLHIQEVHKNSLCSFWSEVNFIFFSIFCSSRTKFS